MRQKWRGFSFKWGGVGGQYSLRSMFIYLDAIENLSQVFMTGNVTRKDHTNSRVATPPLGSCKILFLEKAPSKSLKIFQKFFKILK